MTADPSARLPDSVLADHVPWAKSGSIPFLHTYELPPSFRALWQWFPASLYQDTSTLIWNRNTFRVNMSAEYPAKCCNNRRNGNFKVFFCNDTEEIESLQSMACNMLRFFSKQKISKAFRWKAAFVSCGTLKVLQCKCERPKKEKVCPDVFNKEDTETGEQSKKRCNQEVCELKENISSLRSCWNKFQEIISR